jgi:uncharacterized protein
MEQHSRIIAALLLALGLTAGGWLVGHGFYRGRSVERFVTVKGVAERSVTADTAFWPLRFVATDDDLNRAQNVIRDSRAKVLAFLESHGLPAASAELQALEVTDRLADPYRSGPVESRYIIAQTLMVRSTEPERIRQASQDVGDLVAAGVVLAASGGPTYLFTRLNDLKPEMIAEATANARQAAQQFAKDSASRLGAIRRASQGVFVILPRDQAPGFMEENQMEKTVRVVSTVEFYLDN